MPEGDEDTNFKALSSYFFKELRANTSKLIRRTAMINIPEQAKKLEGEAMQLRFRLNWHELEKELLKRFDTQLASKKYITGDTLTWLDICLCCELYQITSSYQCELPEDYPQLRRWFDEMKQLEAIKHVNDELDQVLEAPGMKQERPNYSASIV